MTNTAVRPPVVIFEEPKAKFRYRVAASVVAVLAAGAIAVGVASLNSAPAVVWNYPTNLEELVERGFIPEGSATSSSTKWAIPTSIDDLIESGFDPTS